MTTLKTDRCASIVRPNDCAGYGLLAFKAPRAKNDAPFAQVDAARRNTCWHFIGDCAA